MKARLGNGNSIFIQGPRSFQITSCIDTLMELGKEKEMPTYSTRDSLDFMPPRLDSEKTAVFKICIEDEFKSYRLNDFICTAHDKNFQLIVPTWFSLDKINTLFGKLGIFQFQYID